MIVTFSYIKANIVDVVEVEVPMMAFLKEKIQVVELSGIHYKEIYSHWIRGFRVRDNKIQQYMVILHTFLFI